MSMGQAQPFSAVRPAVIDHLAGLRRILSDLEAGEICVMKEGVDNTPTYILVLKTQIGHLETLLED
jgi:hypothetical protein